MSFWDWVAIGGVAFAAVSLVLWELFTAGKDGRDFEQPTSVVEFKPRRER